MRTKDLTDPIYRAALLKQLRGDIAQTENDDLQIVTFERNATIGLRNMFPEKFLSMGKQVDTQRKIESRKTGSRNAISHGINIDINSDEFFDLIAQAIIEHRHRYSVTDWTEGSKNDWADGIRQLYEVSANARDQLDALFHKVQELDPDSSERLRSLIVHLFKLADEKVPLTFADQYGFSTIHMLKKISELKNDIDLYCIAAPLMLGEEPKGNKLKKPNHRPGSPYLEPAMSLIQVWELLTGRRASEPKNQSKRIAKKASNDFSADQPSTEFVRLGLLMVDDTLTPRSSASKAVTAIKLALACDKWRAQLFDRNIQEKDEGLTIEAFHLAMLREKQKPNTK